MGEIGNGGDTAAHHAGGMKHHLLGIQPAHFRVAPDLRPAGEDQVLRAFFGAQCMLGIFEFKNLALDVLALAAAAVAGLAAVGEGDARAQHRVEHCFTGFGEHGVGAVGDVDSMAHAVPGCGGFVYDVCGVNASFTDGEGVLH